MRILLAKVEASQAYRYCNGKRVFQKQNVGRNSQDKNLYHLTSCCLEPFTGGDGSNGRKIMESLYM